MYIGTTYIARPLRRVNNLVVAFRRHCRGKATAGRHEGSPSLHRDRRVGHSPCPISRSEGPLCMTTTRNGRVCC